MGLMSYAGMQMTGEEAPEDLVGMSLAEVRLWFPGGILLGAISQRRQLHPLRRPLHWLRHRTP